MSSYVNMQNHLLQHQLNANTLIFNNCKWLLKSLFEIHLTYDKAVKCSTLYFTFGTLETFCAVQHTATLDLFPNLIYFETTGLLTLKRHPKCNFIGFKSSLKSQLAFG